MQPDIWENRGNEAVHPRKVPGFRNGDTEGAGAMFSNEYTLEGADKWQSGLCHKTQAGGVEQTSVFSQTCLYITRRFLLVQIKTVTPPPTALMEGLNGIM